MMSYSNREAVPGTLTCVALLSVIRISLRWRGLGRTLHWARRLTATKRNRDTALGRELVENVVGAVSVAGAYLPGRVRCLEQSVAIQILLRRRGVASELKIGVQPFGFMAHAWIEYCGKPVGESDLSLDNVVPFPQALL
jgi:hypothetical protein